MKNNILSEQISNLEAAIELIRKGKNRVAIIQVDTVIKELQEIQTK